MSKFRKSRLASAMLCTLLFGGNAAGAMKKDMSEIISKNDLSTKDNELENRKPDDSGNPLLKYFLYFLGGAASVAKLADEGVGVAEAKEYIQNKKFSPLGKLSIYKNLVARSYRAKTIETMRKFVDVSNKHKQNIYNFFNKVIEQVCKIKDNENGCVKVKVKVKDKVKVKENLFDISSAAAEDKYLNIKDICHNAGLTGKDLVIPEYVEEYVKAVLGVSVEQCDKILVNVCSDVKYRCIAFVKGDVCLRLRPLGYNGEFEFCLTCLDEELGFISDDYVLDLYDNSYGYSVALPYMERILGVKHDENYIDISTNGHKEKSYSFYGQIFRDLEEDWKGNTPSGKEFAGYASKIFPDLFSEKEKEEVEIIEE